MRKEHLCEVARESQEFIASNPDELFPHTTSLVDGDTVDFSPRFSKNAKISVVNMTTYKALESYSGRIGILNFASAKHPGGGFLRGAMAQEESLCYGSNLYNTLLEQSDFYKKPLAGGYYSNWMIVSRDITFFRDEQYEMLEEFLKCDVVITSASVNCSALAYKGSIDTVMVREIMLGRVRGILGQFVKEGCDTLVLGAFGCGVFKNNPYEIARVFREVLLKEGYARGFKEVVFGIPENSRDRNYSAFREILR